MAGRELEETSVSQVLAVQTLRHDQLGARCRRGEIDPGLLRIHRWYGRCGAGTEKQGGDGKQELAHGRHSMGRKY
jgi:hypothetical protein